MTPGPACCRSWSASGSILVDLVGSQGFLGSDQNLNFPPKADAGRSFAWAALALAEGLSCPRRCRAADLQA